MICRAFKYKCPLCGISLAAPFTEEQIENDTPVMRRACERGGQPAGCGKPHWVRPSDGVEVPDPWDRLVETVVL
jgi:hypothetical protein